MSEPLIPLGPSDEADASGAARKKQLTIVGGIAGVALVGFGAFYLLSSGSSDNNAAIAVPVHHTVATASPAPAATTSAESVLQTYHGSVGDRDPFGIPAAVLAAQPVAGAPGAGGGSAGSAGGAGGGATASASPTAAATLPPEALPFPTAFPSGTTVPLPGPPPTAMPPAPLPDQYLQLLAYHHTGSGWTVDVRTASGIAKNVKPNTKNVDGTLFYFQGEDETSGSPTFVFTVGESQGGNLVPNPTQSAKKPVSDKSTLILHDGVVDGGIYSD